MPILLLARVSEAGGTVLPALEDVAHLTEGNLDGSVLSREGGIESFVNVKRDHVQGWTNRIRLAALPELGRAAHGWRVQRGFDPGQRLAANVGGWSDDDRLRVHLPDGGRHFGDELGVIRPLVFPICQVAVGFVVQFPSPNAVALLPAFPSGQRAARCITGGELPGKGGGGIHVDGGGFAFFAATSPSGWTAGIAADDGRLHQHIELSLVSRDDESVEGAPGGRSLFGQVNRPFRFQSPPVNRHESPAQAHTHLLIHVLGLWPAAHGTALAIPTAGVAKVRRVETVEPTSGRMAGRRRGYGIGGRRVSLWHAVEKDEHRRHESQKNQSHAATSPFCRFETATASHKSPTRRDGGSMAQCGWIPAWTSRPIVPRRWKKTQGGKRGGESAAHPQVAGDILDRGGKRSATPLSASLPSSQSGVSSDERSIS